jgi:hypothetical protein
VKKRKGRSRKKKHKTFILVLDKDDPERELDFELDFQASLTMQERFEMMFKHSREVAGRAIRDGSRKAPAVIKRA